jgi:hypothetical protein
VGSPTTTAVCSLVGFDEWSKLTHSQFSMTELTS